MHEPHPLAKVYVTDDILQGRLTIMAGAFDVERLDAVIRTFELLNNREPTFEELAEELRHADGVDPQRTHGYADAAFHSLYGVSDPESGALIVEHLRDELGREPSISEVWAAVEEARWMGEEE